MPATCTWVETPAPAPAPATRSTTAEPAAPASGEAMVTYRLPVTLPRPIDMPMVTNEMLIALDPDLNGVALPFVKDAKRPPQTPDDKKVAPDTQARKL
ncbi:hypothetical protein FRB95_002502 [Tulasnella sp. JGI-2019a]|nr:hypothetical protein FRB95_002502 [Tulasnella sp. JGI-2019a]